jgi:hypothetical protein
LPHLGEAVALEGTTTAWVALQNGTLTPVDLASGHVGSAVHVGGRPSAVAIPAGWLLVPPATRTDYPIHGSVSDLIT